VSTVAELEKEDEMNITVQQYEFALARIEELIDLALEERKMTKRNWPGK